MDRVVCAVMIFFFFFRFLFTMQYANFIVMQHTIIYLFMTMFVSK